MPTLTLTVVRHPEYGTAEQRLVRGRSLTIGRDTECDWALPDPLKSLSRRHCQLELVGGTWQARDLSSNGTFVNDAAAPIGRNAMKPVQDGDRLRLGDYEMEIRILAEDSQTIGQAAEPPVVPQPFGEAAAQGFAAVRLPGLDDPPSDAVRRHRGPALQSFGAMPDHAAASSQAFVPPAGPEPARPASKPLVPDDWYAQAEPAPAPTPRAAPAAPSAVARVTPEPIEGPVPGSEPMSEPAPASASPVEFPFASIPAPAESGVPKTAAAESPLAAAPAGAGGMGSAMAALWAGGGLPPGASQLAAADPEAALRNAGALLRIAVAGLRALLMARGSVKREFRIEQTMLMPRENNLLKFAASDEQALAALLDPGTTALRAVQESIDDLTVHQVAVLAATQAAARALLDQLDPAALKAQDAGGGIFPGAQEKRLWEAYKSRHARLIEQFEDDFESAFGKAFALAYEKAVLKDKD